MNNLLFSITAAGFLALLIASPGCNPTVAKSSTPQDAFDNLQDAIRDRNWTRYCECLTPECADRVTGWLVQVSSMMKKVGKNNAEMRQLVSKLESVVSKYSVDDGLGQNSNDLVSTGHKIKDKPMFMKAYLGILESEGSRPPTVPFQDATLSTIETDGDTATATLKMSRMEIPVTFKKIDGSWRMNVERLF